MHLYYVLFQHANMKSVSITDPVMWSVVSCQNTGCLTHTHKCIGTNPWPPSRLGGLTPQLHSPTLLPVILHPSYTAVKILRAWACRSRVSNDLDASSRQGRDGLRDPLLQAVLHSCGPQQGEVCLYGLCLSCHCFFPPLQCHTGFMIAGAPHLRTLYGCDFCVFPALKQYRLSHDRWKAHPSSNRYTRLHEAKTDIPAGDEDLAVGQGSATGALSCS